MQPDHHTAHPAPSAAPADTGSSAVTPAMREQVQHALHHFAHMLSEQGPMNITFVHNNTLLGLQKQTFVAAIAEAQRVLGGRGFLPNETYREHHRIGRIDDSDIDVALTATADAATLNRVVASLEQREVTVREVRGAHLRHGIDAIEAAELRWKALDGSLQTRLLAGLPEAVRSRLLAGAKADAAADRQRVGRDWTLAHWLQTLTGVDLPGAVRRAVLEAPDSGNDFAAASEANLRALGIAETAWGGYLVCIDRALGNVVVPAQSTRARELWLREERVRCQTIAQSHLGVDGDLVSLDGWIGANPQAYAATTLWKGALAAFDLADPYGRSDPGTLQERDPAIAVNETLGVQARHMQHFGGPALALDAAERAAIDRLVREHVRTLAQTGTDSGPLREQARLCWLVLHELGDAHLDRTGADALRALISMLPATAQVGEVAAIVAARDPRQRMAEHAQALLDADLAALRGGRSHADWLALLTGDDAGERVNRYMIRLSASFMDDGLAAWHMPGRSLGFFDAWRNLAASDRSFDFEGLDGWREALHALPVMPEDAIVHCLRQLGIAPTDWDEAIGRQLARLKGWAGMAYWFEMHPKHDKQAAQPISTAQFVAVRLFCETQFVRREVRRRWGMDPQLASLAQHFGQHLPEYFVRRSLHAGHVGDDLADEVRALDIGARDDDAQARWAELADRAWMLHESDLSPRRASANAFREGWRLFTLAQHLGLRGSTVRSLPVATRDALLAELDAFPSAGHGYTWLLAFERHYRDEVLNAIALNHGRGRWLKRATRPKSQVIFCIDEREENIHRHFEELDPGHETLGAAGFFGVALSYSGLDDHDRTPLCPAVATPAHRVYEVPRENHLDQRAPLHHRRRGWLSVLQDTYWELKRNVVSSYFTVDLLGFVNAIPLFGRVLAPVGYGQAASSFRGLLVPAVNTRLMVTRPDESETKRYSLIPHALPIGFTDTEQADRCEAMLRNTGLTYAFARIVVWCAHGSASANNPHENAHDCGACGGKGGAPNSRAISAMLNRPAVRKLLRERGIDIPEDTWFVGAIHNTASDLITFADTEDIPVRLRAHFDAIEFDLHEASRRAAQERCRRFGSSPKDDTPEASLRHVVGRSVDFSQVRPEWGHATNAFAAVGRRSLTQGVFFDRRGFVISYDASQDDPTGKILERIVMAVGPVGAGINLEYYFSTVDPKVYGCDTKVPHNVTGMIGVMEGAQSDLRTGLPTQMTEVHEAMRLQLIIEAAPEVLGGIYGRQAPVRELLDGGWVHLVSVHPQTGEINCFVPGVGFVRWNEPSQAIPEVAKSFDWYRGKYEGFLPPARITEPTRPWSGSHRLPDTETAMQRASTPGAPALVGQRGSL